MNHADIEVLWVDAWNDLFHLTNDRPDYLCILLPDYTPATVVECQAWIQESVYDGYSITLTKGWFQGRPAILADRALRQVS